MVVKIIITINNKFEKSKKKDTLKRDVRSEMHVGPITNEGSAGPVISYYIKQIVYYNSMLIDYRKSSSSLLM